MLAEMVCLRTLLSEMSCKYAELMDAFISYLSGVGTSQIRRRSIRIRPSTAKFNSHSCGLLLPCWVNPRPAGGPKAPLWFFANSS